MSEKNKISLTKYFKGDCSTLDREQMKDFGHDAAFYEDYLSLQAKDKFDEVVEISSVKAYENNKIAEEFLENVQKGHEKVETIKHQETDQMIRRLKNEHDSLKRAGYIEASIILYGVFLMGLFIAVGLLILQK